MFGVGIPSLNMVVINIFKPTLAELSGLGGGGGGGGGGTKKGVFC